MYGTTSDFSQMWNFLPPFGPFDPDCSGQPDLHGILEWILENPFLDISACCAAPPPVCWDNLQIPRDTRHSFPEYPQIPRHPPLPTRHPVSLSAKISSPDERRIFGSRCRRRLADEAHRNQGLFICFVPPLTCRCKEEGAASVMLDNTLQVFSQKRGGKRWQT